VYAGFTPGRLLIVMPAAWCGLEYLRGTLFTGFPWGVLGYSQFPASRLIQIGDMTGVYGVSFLPVLWNAGLFIALLWLTKGDWKGIRVSGKTAFASLASAGVLLCGVYAYGMWRIDQVDRAAAAAPHRTVAVVQGNIDQAVKWHPAFQIDTVKTYLRLSRSVSADMPRLIVWPETAMPFYLNETPRLTKMVNDGIAGLSGEILLGSPAFGRRGGRDVYYNRAYLLRPDGTVTGRYDKAHLVPFGEYVPRWLPFVGKMVTAVGDFIPGRAGKTLPWHDTALGVQICYEIIFPDLSRELAANGAGLIVNITNDAWYGETGAPYQFFEMAAFRAVENRRAVVRSANTGISGFIDPAGRILRKTGIFTEAAVSEPVPVMTGTSIYGRIGDAFVFLCLILTGMAVVTSAVRT